MQTKRDSSVCKRGKSANFRDNHAFSRILASEYCKFSSIRNVNLKKGAYKASDIKVCEGKL